MPRPDPSAAPLEITRDFYAPVQEVFAQWIDADALAQWFAPDGYAVSEVRIDARPGGSWLVQYERADGAWVRESGKFETVQPPEVLQFTLTQIFSSGRIGPETLVRVILADLGDRTRMDFLQTGPMPEEMRAELRAGWATCFDKLTRNLPQP